MHLALVDGERDALEDLFAFDAGPQVSNLEISQLSSTPFLDFVSAIWRGLAHPCRPDHIRAQQTLVHLLLVLAGETGAGGDVLDRAVAVTDREPTLRKFNHLGHVTVLGGKLRQLADARLKV